MTRPGLRLLAFLCCGAALQAGEVRRPVAAVEIDRREYVRIEDVAARLKADLRWIEAGRRAELTGENHRLEFTAGGRYGGLEMTADGLNVFLGDPVLSRSGELFISRIDLEQRLVPFTHGGWGGEPPRPPRVIVIDPGHGGDDSGAKNPRLRLMEKTLTLDTAFRLQRLLEAQGWKVILTRTTDRKLDHDHDTDLRLRGETAVAARADLFLSIHYDAGPDGDTRSHGTEVYTFPPPRQSSTEDAMQHHDSGEPNAEHPEVASVTREDHWSVMLAHAVHRELIERLHTEDRGEKLRHLGVLRWLNCPGILVEPGFLSNDAEARRLGDPGFRQEIAEALAAGLQDYARELDTLRPKGYVNAPAQPLRQPTRPSSP